MIRLVTLLESIKHEVNIADVNIIKNEMYKAISKLGISSSNVSKLFKEYASLERMRMLLLNLRLIL